MGVAGVAFTSMNRALLLALRTPFDMEKYIGIFKEKYNIRGIYQMA